ncbi:aspartate kinase [bacterium]|jgi:aspartate kinase|nr:aspartate kinase [bacterium]
MTTVVKKFGGSSVGSIERIQRVADRVIADRKNNARIVVVVSAMGDTTDELVSMAGQISESPDPREYDALISTGENISAALLSMTLISKGQPAISLSGMQAGVMTDGRHVKAKILDVKPQRIEKELDEGKVVIVTGFQGINTKDFNITTIGRGGSDTSAVVLAAALNQSECEIYTDVDGVYTTDPRMEKGARKLTEISYDEMLELASLGAKVLHPRAVEVAKENGIELHVRSSFESSEGTRVKEASSMEVNKPVTGIALKKDEAKLSIIHIPDQPGVAGKVFSTLADAGVNVDMIVQSTEQDGSNTITFTVSKDEYADASKVTNEVATALKAAKVDGDTTIAKVSIVGVGMISKPGIAARMFNCLGKNGINIQLITTSEIKVSCAIDESQGELAVQVLHAEFELDRE